VTKLAATGLTEIEDYIVEAGNRWVFHEQASYSLKDSTLHRDVWGWCQIGEEQTNKLSSREKNYSKTHSMLEMKQIKLQFFFTLRSSGETKIHQIYTWVEAQ